MSPWNELYALFVVIGKSRTRLSTSTLNIHTVSDPQFHLHLLWTDAANQMLLPILYQFIRSCMDQSLTPHVHQPHPIAFLPESTAMKAELTIVMVCLWQLLRISTKWIRRPRRLIELEIFFQSPLVLILHRWSRQPPPNNPTSQTTA